MRVRITYVRQQWRWRCLASCIITPCVRASLRWWGLRTEGAVTQQQQQQQQCDVGGAWRNGQMQSHQSAERAEQCWHLSGDTGDGQAGSCFGGNGPSWAGPGQARPGWAAVGHRSTPAGRPAGAVTELPGRASQRRRHTHTHTRGGRSTSSYNDSIRSLSRSAMRLLLWPSKWWWWWWWLCCRWRVSLSVTR